MHYLKFAQEFCKNANGITSIPMTLFKDGEKFFCSERHLLPKEIDIYTPFFKDIYNETRPVSYKITDDWVLFACIRSPQSNLTYLFGPAVISEIDDYNIRKFMSVCGIHPDLFLNFKDYFSVIKAMSFSYLTQLITFFYLTINKETLSPSDLVFESKDIDKAKEEYGKLVARSIELYSDEEPIHSSYSFETDMLFYIKNGQTQKLIQLVEEMPVGQTGKMANTNMRHEKNTAICAVTLATRAAISGGLNVETAFRLSDIAIQKIEMCYTVNEINRISYSLLVEFCNRVAMLQNNNCTDPLINRIIDYVSTRIYERIILQDIAEQFHTSRSFLSTKFKTEIGVPFNEYVNKLKVSEAKSLLLHTDKPLSEISSLLSFASQSHFQNTFKKIVGITPSDYRKNVNKL